MNSSLSSLQRIAQRALHLKANRRPPAHLYPDDPLGYCREHLGVNLWSKQIEIVQKLRTPPYKVLVRSGHNVGKSFLGSCLASWFYDSFPESFTILTGPDQRCVRDVLFAELRRRRKGDPKLAPKAPILEDNESHWIKGYTARDEGFSGRHPLYMMFQFDEATALTHDHFQSLRSMFTGTPEMAAICWYNPLSVDAWVYEEESADDWHKVSISQFEHPNIAAELAGLDPPYPSAVRLSQLVSNMDASSERLRSGSPEQEGEVSLSNGMRWLPGPDAEARILGRWPSAGGSTVWSEGLWQKILKTRFVLNPLWRVWIGVDVAFYGDDQTCFVVKQGPCILRVERRSGWGPKKSCEYLKQLCEEHKGPPENPYTRGNPRKVFCLIDAGGSYGTGVQDYRDGHQWELCVPNSVAMNEELYHNTRSELWFVGRQHALDGAIDLTRISEVEKQRLRAELFSANYFADPHDRYTICPKEEMKVRLKRSPDSADGYNLACYAYEVSK